MAMNGEIVAGMTSWQAVGVIVAMLTFHAASQWVRGHQPATAGGSVTNAVEGPVVQARTQQQMCSAVDPVAA
jgi:hypothetical protein